MKLPKLKVFELDLSHCAEWNKKAGKMNSPWGQYWASKGEIFLEKSQPTHEYLDSLIHELLHAAFPKMSEAAVAKTASWMAWAIWQSSLRRRIAENKENLK